MSKNLNELSSREEFDLKTSLNKVNSLVTSQAITLLSDENFVQELNAQMKTLKEEIEKMEEETTAHLNVIEEREKEVQEINEMKKGIIYSTDLLKKGTVLFDQQCRQYENELKIWQQRCSSVLNEQNANFEHLRNTIIADSKLYNQLEKLKTEEKILNVDLKYKSSLLEQMKDIKTKKNQIKKDIFNADIIKFVKVVQEYKSNEKLFEEIQKLQELENSLQLRYKELQNINAKKEVKESTRCLGAFQGHEFDELPPFSSTFVPTSLKIFEGKLPSIPFKTPPVLEKRKSRDNDIIYKPEKIQRTNSGTSSKINILNVKTINTSKDLNRSTGFEVTPSCSNNNYNEGDNVDSKIEVTDKRIVKVYSSEFLKDLCPPTSSTQSKTVSPPIDKPVNVNKITGDGDSLMGQFSIGNMSSVETDMLNISTEDIDNEMLLSTSNIAGGGFMLSPPRNTEDEMSFFKNSKEDRFFKLF